MSHIVLCRSCFFDCHAQIIVPLLLHRKNVHLNTTVVILMNSLSGNAGELKLYAYNDTWKLVEVPKEQWQK